MRHVETALNLTWTLTGAAVCAYALSLGLVGDFGPGSGYFPFLVGFLLAACGLALLAARGTRVPEGTRFWDSADGRGRVVRLAFVLVAMIAAMPWLGFTLSALLAVPLMIRAFDDSGWVFSIAVAVGVAVSVHVVFVLVLRTPLPRGVLGI